MIFRQGKLITMLFFFYFHLILFLLWFTENQAVIVIQNEDLTLN